MWKCISENKRKYDFGGIWSPDLLCSFITAKTLSYSVTADWDLKPGPLLFFYKGWIPHTKIKSISTTHTRTKSISMLTLKPSDLWPASKNQINFDHPHKNQVNFDAHTKTKRFAARIQKSNQFRPPPQKRSITALKTSRFRPAHSQFRPPAQKQVNFDPITKNKSNSIPHTKIKAIATSPLKSSPFDRHSKIKFIPMPRHNNQVIFDPATKTKHFSNLIQKPSHSDPDTETKSSLIPHTEIKSISTTRTKT